MIAVGWSVNRWLAEVTGGLSALRELDSEIPTRLVYGANANGRLSFGIITKQIPEIPAMSSAVVVTRVKRDHDQSWLLLFTLDDQFCRDVFVRLCEQIYLAVRQECTEEAGLGRMLATIEEWRSLLKIDTRILSIEKIRGLFAELHFTFEVLTPRIGVAPALDAWQGPYGGDQDFVFPAARYELKSRRTMSRAVEISSEYQLAGEDIVLVVVEVTDASVQFEGAMTLGEKLQAVRSMEMLTGPALENFEQALEELRVDPQDARYDDRYLRCGTVDYYRVSGNFPRITGDQIHEDIGGVRYKIDLDSLEQYGIDEREALLSLEK